MPKGQPDSRELGLYFTIAQVGLEMVVPVVVGVLLENSFEHWRPWGVVVGAVLGLTTGIMHLVILSNRQDRHHADKTPREEPP
jgi:F0F1-type ATP synthase assembly protein I